MILLKTGCLPLAGPAFKAVHVSDNMSSVDVGGDEGIVFRTIRAETLLLGLVPEPTKIRRYMAYIVYNRERSSLEREGWRALLEKGLLEYSRHCLLECLCHCSLRQRLLKYLRRRPLAPVSVPSLRSRLPHAVASSTAR